MSSFYSSLLLIVTNCHMDDFQICLKFALCVCVNLLAFYIRPFLFHRILVGFPLLLLAYLTSFNQLQKLCLCSYETQYLPQQINVQITSFLKIKRIILLSVALKQSVKIINTSIVIKNGVLIIPS